jgi:MFS family permease
LIDFFITSQGLTYTENLFNLAVSNSAIIGMIALPLMIIAPFYRALPDKYGRKPFLVINTFGMAIGMAVCAMSNSFMMYVVGSAISGFFILHDMQVVYIMEVAPPEKRARFYAIAKSVGALGTVLIPAMRSVFMDADSSQWRLVYYVPVIIGCVTALIALLIAKETKPFLSQRIAYLETPLEERKRKTEEEKTKKKSDPNKMGVFPAIKYIWNNKDSRTLLFIVTIYYVVSMAFASYFEPIMVTSGMSTENATKALYMYGFMFAGCTFVAGFFADSRLGRKGTVGLFGSLSIVMFCLSQEPRMDGILIWLVYATGFILAPTGRVATISR